MAAGSDIDYQNCVAVHGDPFEDNNNYYEGRDEQLVDRDENHKDKIVEFCSEIESIFINK